MKPDFYAVDVPFYRDGRRLTRAERAAERDIVKATMRQLGGWRHATRVQAEYVVGAVRELHGIVLEVGEGNWL